MSPEVSINGIAVGDMVVDVTVRADDASLEHDVDRMATDLRDRAYRVADAVEKGIHPDEAEKHPVRINWEDVVDRGADA